MELQRAQGSAGFRLDLRKGSINAVTGECVLDVELLSVPQVEVAFELCDAEKGAPYLREFGGGVDGALAPQPSPSPSPAPGTASPSPSFGSSPSPMPGNGTGGGDDGGGNGGIIAAVIVVVLLLGGVGVAYYWFGIIKQPIPGCLEPCLGARAKGISSYKGPGGEEETIQNPMTGTGTHGSPSGSAVDLTAAGQPMPNDLPPTPYSDPEDATGGPGFAAPMGDGAAATGSVEPMVGG